MSLEQDYEDDEGTTRSVRSFPTQAILWFCDVSDEIAHMWKKMALRIIFNTVMKRSFSFY